MSLIRVIGSLVNSVFKPASIQYPLPVDGDAVYEKDIDIVESTPGTFTGDVQDLYNTYGITDILVDTSATNPKTLSIKFNRPITANSVGFSSAENDFSNVKIDFKDTAGTVRQTIDDSSNNTKYSSRLYPFTKATFLQMDVEFHTADTVGLNASLVPKIEAMSISAIDGYVSETNTSDIALGIDGVFEGGQVDTINYGMILIATFADEDSATDGLSIQFRSTPTGTWRESDSFTLGAGEEKVFSVQTVRRFMRIVYTNGGVGQTEFDLQTTLKPVYVKPSSHRVTDTINGQDDAELVKANLTAQSLLTDLFENISSYRGTLNVNNAWVNRKIVNETFHQHDGTTNLNSAASEGDISISVDDTTGFIVGSEIKLEETVAGVGVQEIGVMTITIVAAGTPGTLTLDRPIGFDYTTAALVSNVETDMSSVVGSLASPEIYEIDPPPGTIWQFTRIIFSMVHSAAGDDGKFGGIAALTNGVALRATTAAGRTVVYANWKTNADISLDMYDVVYTDKAPAGANGTKGRWTFTKAEVVAELDGDASPIQKLEVLVQDDLTGLTSFTMRAQGRVFSP